MSVVGGPNLVTSGLIFNLDANNFKCYIGSGTNVTDLATGSINTLSGTYGFDSTTYSANTITLNNNSANSDGKITCTTANLSNLAVTQNFTVMFAAKKNFYGIAGNNVGNSQLFQGVTNGYNNGWRISESSQGTPGTAFTGRHNFYFGYNDINTSLGASDSAVNTNRMNIVAFTISSTTITGFCNGIFTTRVNPLTYVGGTSSPVISFTGAGNGSFNGLLGFLMIYNRELSQSEVIQNYNALKNRYYLS